MADTSSSTRSSRSSRTSSSRSGTRTSTSRSGAASSTGATSSVWTVTPTASSSETALLSQSASAGSSSVTLVSSVTSTPTSDASGAPAKGLSGAVIAVVVILVVLVVGAVTFLLVLFTRKRSRKQRASRSPYGLTHEPKHKDSYLQPALTDSSIYLSYKVERDSDGDTIVKSKSLSVDSDLLLSPKSRARSSRASSSIFPEDDMTMTSRRTFLRPLSLGESPASLTLRGMQMANGSSTQLSPLVERSNSNGVDYEQRLTPIPGTPATPGIVFDPPDSVHDEESGPAAPPQILTSARTEDRYSNPPTPIIALPPLPLAPPARDSSDVPHKRNSFNRLAPSRYRPPTNDSRPQSMVSVYSTQTQDQGMVLDPSALSPDVLAALERLKNRISTAWSLNSVDTYRFNKPSAPPTEEA